MESVELAPDRPAVTVDEIDEPTMAGAGIELFDLDAVQLQSLPFRVRRVVVRLACARAPVCSKAGSPTSHSGREHGVR